MEIDPLFLSNDLEEQEQIQEQQEDEEMDFCMDQEPRSTTRLLSSTSSSSSNNKNESKQWMESLEKAIRAIVSIRLLSVRAFDGNGASFSVATGFVVDLKRGIILTNRHVVTPGPVVADAIFLNKEEVDLIPIYRDPVHDFGFFQFDPSKIKFLQLAEIPLQPEGAKIGVEIRVVGNDAGEKLSILPGILAKLDREAPNYGSSSYNDFNTFYYAAASSTSGGSSGSPVLNIDGAAIALNAGGAKKAASSFYLPLDRVVRALKWIQTRQDTSLLPARGTLQTIFRHTAFDEVRRLGLSSETEAQVRQKYPQETGMLVVDQVIQNGPAFGKLQTGDVLIQFDHQIETTFLAIEAFLDDHVGHKVTIQVQRGQQVITTEIEIQDLHAITPNQYLEVGGGIVHALSYQQARNAALPCGGVYLAQDGHMFVKAHLTPPCIIVAVDGKPTPDLNSFIQVLQSLPNLYRTVVRYFMIRDRHRIRTAFITMDRQWFPLQLYTRNDTDGKWYPTNDTGKEGTSNVPEIPLVRPPPSVAPTPLSFPGEGPNKQIGQQVLRSLVMVTFDIPYMIDGISSSSYHGLGVVIDASKGLILVDQNTVPIALGDVLVTIAASIEIPAKVVFVHPVHNFSIVQFDVKSLGDATASQLKSIEFSQRPLQVGDVTEYIGLSGNWTVVTMKTLVTKIDRLVLRDFQPPRYKASNIEVLHFDRITKSVGGVFIDPEGKLSALWLSFSYQDPNGRKDVFRGVASEVFTPILQDVLCNQISPQVNVLPVQLLTYSLSKARAGLGLTDKWIEQIEKRYEDKRQILAVKRCAAGTSCSTQLQSGDLFLSINGQVVVRDLDVERAALGNTKLDILVLRDQKEVSLQVDTTKLSSLGTDRVVIWCGLVLQRPHFAVASLGYIPEEVYEDGQQQVNHSAGVYISRWCYGSPAHKYGLRATIWIVEVNGQAIKNLDDLLNIVNTIEDGKSVRIRTIALNTKPKVFTLKTDYHYWPTVEIKRHDQYEWKYVHHTTSTSTS